MGRWVRNAREGNSNLRVMGLCLATCCLMSAVMLAVPGEPAQAARETGGNLSGHEAKATKVRHTHARPSGHHDRRQHEPASVPAPDNKHVGLTRGTGEEPKIELLDPERDTTRKDEKLVKERVEESKGTKTRKAGVERPARNEGYPRINFVDAAKQGKTSSDRFAVRGFVEGPRGTKVRVGEADAKVSDANFFSAEVRLAEGPNEIPVIVTGPRGERNEETFEVSYEPLLESAEADEPAKPEAKRGSITSLAIPTGTKITVNSTDDAVDANPGDGACETAQDNGTCTLRAAVQETNVLDGPNTIELPGGTYGLTLPLADDSGYFTNNDKEGDLDVVDDLTIEGEGQDKTVDTGAPTANAPAETIVSPSQLGTTAIPVGLSWSAADAGSGVARYEVEQSTNGGAYSAVGLPTATTTSTDHPLAPGNTYRFRARAQDKAGNWSAWAEAPGFALSAPQENGTGVTYPAGTWTAASSTSFYGGAVKYVAPTALGPRARYTFAGGEVAFVTTKGGNRGRAEVWVDGVKQTTLDLYASTTQIRQVVYRKAGLDPAVTHTIEVRPTGTKNASSTSTRVDVDAFVAVR